MLVGDALFELVGAAAGQVEPVEDIRVGERGVGIVRQQVLLGDIGDIMGALILGKQVVEGLVLAGPDFLRDGFIPFSCICKLRVHVENYTPEWKHAVADNLADLELGNMCGHGIVATILVYRVGQ